MQKTRLYFLAMVIVFLSASWVHAQSNIITTTRDKEITAKELNNTPLKPAQSRPGIAVDIPNTDMRPVLTQLTVGPDGSGSNGRRLCQLTIRNSSSQPMAYGQYFLKYWSRTGASDSWDHYYGSTFQWTIPSHQTKTLEIHVGMPSGATEFRVTLNKDSSSPILSEISAPVI